MQVQTDFMQFLREHTDKEWQRKSAARFILTTSQLLVVITFTMAVALITTGLTLARELIPYFSIATLTSITLYIAVQKNIVRYGGVLLTLFYLLFGLILLHCVGVAPAPIAAFSGAIVVSGLLYGFWCSLIPTALSTSALLGFKLAEQQGSFRPDYVVLPKANDLTMIVVAIIWLHVVAIMVGALRLTFLHKGVEANEAASHRLYTHDLIINTDEHEVKRGTTIIPLRRKEYEVLEYLVRNKGQSVSRTMISEELWGGAVSSNSIDVHIKHLRDKLDKPFRTQLIETTHKVGYTIKDLPLHK